MKLQLFLCKFTRRNKREITLQEYLHMLYAHEIFLHVKFLFVYNFQVYLPKYGNSPDFFAYLNNWNLFLCVIWNFYKQLYKRCVFWGVKSGVGNFVILKQLKIVNNFRNTVIISNTIFTDQFWWRSAATFSSFSVLEQLFRNVPIIL